MRALTLAKTAGAAAATAVLGGLATGPAVQSKWYQTLRKPSFQPPKQAFPIVWPLLYTDVAVVSAATLDALDDRGAHDEARTYTKLLVLNLVLNGSWSWLFFNRRQLGPSAVLAGALAVSSADLTARAVRVNGTPAKALWAYPAWCAFATVLSSRIWWLNR
ncbi:tryptophan-rich sensory protein [Mycobacterium yunnanensis]|uniref:Tryptophan-rich sensory protein n=1 Tax=Mycobacterium yunnanensis TaxID=368477 RepID=A0A9X3C4I1_9MYCO|nr:TspO/MBR family protein [Mycobacterium yunnanensis]MCV7424491.1 tryptophan-rich sensory protein [Mycobacterium yunnanensis]